MEDNNKEQVQELKEHEITWGGWLNEFLWICAGVNRKVLRQCPTDYAKYAGIGGTILFTALMAMLSGGFAMYKVFDNSYVAIAFGVFWGLLIFNLDRFIVNTMYSDGKATISRQEFFSGLPRIIMAIFLGIVISTPLELKIFEDEIKVVIGEQIQDRIRNYQAEDNAKIIQLQARRDSLSAFKSELSSSPLVIDWTIGNNEQINILISEKRDKNGELDSARKKRENLIQEQRWLYRKATYQDSISANNLYPEIRKINQHISAIESNLNQIDSRLASYSDDNKEIASKARETRQNELQGLQFEIDLVDREIVELKESMKNNKYSDLIESEYGGFQAQMSAFAQMKKENSSTAMSSLFIMLLFIIIETAPTFFKMMMEDGPYDKLLDTEKYRIAVMCDKKISEINDEINTLLKISTSANQNKLEAELKANKELMDKVATVQAELLKTSIDLWRESELKKINDDPTIYLKMEKNND